jgi:hypothetical protein
MEDLADTTVKHNALVWALSSKYPEWNLKPFDDSLVKKLDGESLNPTP